MPAIKITGEPSLSGHGYLGSYNVYYVKLGITTHLILQPIISTAWIKYESRPKYRHKKPGITGHQVSFQYVKAVEYFFEVLLHADEK